MKILNHINNSDTISEIKSEWEKLSNDVDKWNYILSYENIKATK